MASPHGLSTVSQYLGDVRLTYNAPDPDLNLFDMKRVEVIEGPQGTLYRAGSLDGIVRIAANDPQMDTVSAQLSGGWIDGIGFPGNPALGLSQPKAASTRLIAGNGLTHATIVMNYRHGLFGFGPLPKTETRP